VILAISAPLDHATVLFSDRKLTSDITN